MRSTATHALTLALGLLAAACDSGPSAPPPGAPGGGDAPGGGGGPPVLGWKAPEYTPSGIKEDFKQWKDAKSAVAKARLEDEKTQAEQALKQLTDDLVAKWAAREVPAMEALYYATILKGAEKNIEAAAQYRRYLGVGDPTSGNYMSCTVGVIGCLAEAGDFDGAMQVLEKAKDTTFKDHEMDLKSAHTTIAMNMMMQGKLAEAARSFESAMTTGPGDDVSAIHSVDCYQRIGKPDDAMRVAQKAVDFFKEGKQAERMALLLQATKMVGRPAPDFTGAAHWRGEGGPVTRDMMAGHVTVVFSWNMSAQWMRFFFKRVNAMAEELAPKGVIFVGISRLAKFDANKMITKEDMTDEDELLYYDAWVREYGVKYPLAIGPYGDPGEAFMNTWSATVIPAFTVIGKDGKVFYTRTGKNDEEVDAVKEMVEKALQ